MQLRLIVLTLASTLSVAQNSLSFAQSGGPEIGAVIDNVEFDKNMTTAVVRVFNQSAKDITAFNLSVDVHYRNGRTKHFERLIELLPKMVFQQMVSASPTLGEGALHPGKTEEVAVNLVPPSDKNLVLSADIRLDMAVALDLSAQGSNQGAIERLVTLRKGHADADLKAAEIISAAAADSVTPDARGMALRQLRELQVEQQKKNNDTGGFSIELQSIIHDLERDQNIDLRSYARQRNRDALTKLAHVNISRRAN
jgi:hypothetical protein